MDALWTVRQHSRLWIGLAALLAWTGCDDPVPELLPRQLVLDEPAPVQAPPESPAILDDHGVLLASEEHLAGLTLPRGLVLTRQSGRRHVYHSQVEVAKVQAFFGPRLLTGAVERRGEGAIYRAAVPREVRGGVVRLDVSVLPSSRGGTRLVIDELPPPGARDGANPRETRRNIEAAYQQLD